MCNSWMWKVETPPPCRWLEECLVEAFSIRGLGRLADGWERNPAFSCNDSRYAQALRDYRRALVEKYRTAGGPEGVKDMAVWLRDNRKLLDETTGLGVYAGPAILTIVAAMESDKGCVEDLGAVNRWPERSGVALEHYLGLWREELRAACGAWTTAEAPSGCFRLQERNMKLRIFVNRYGNRSAANASSLNATILTDNLCALLESRWQGRTDRGVRARVVGTVARGIAVAASLRSSSILSAGSKSGSDDIHEADEWGQKSLQPFVPGKRAPTFGCKCHALPKPRTQVRTTSWFGLPLGAKYGRYQRVFFASICLKPASRAAMMAL